MFWRSGELVSIPFLYFVLFYFLVKDFINLPVCQNRGNGLFPEQSFRPRLVAIHGSFYSDIYIYMFTLYVYGYGI